MAIRGLAAAAATVLVLNGCGATRRPADSAADAEAAARRTEAAAAKLEDAAARLERLADRLERRNPGR
jgi:hypothetical protein